MIKKRLLVHGEWMDVDPPTPPELDAIERGATWVSGQRLAEIAAYLEAQRTERELLTPNDRKFLRSLRIEPWTA